MMKSRRMLLGGLATVFLMAAPAALAENKDGSSLHLMVGPGINATFAIRTMRGSCSDDAVCRFDVPSNSAFDIVAGGRADKNYRWTGCSVQSEPAKCRVEVRGEPVLVTIR